MVPGPQPHVESRYHQASSASTSGGTGRGPRAGASRSRQTAARLSPGPRRLLSARLAARAQPQALSSCSSSAASRSAEGLEDAQVAPPTPTSSSSRPARTISRSVSFVGSRTRRGAGGDDPRLLQLAEELVRPTRLGEQVVAREGGQRLAYQAARRLSLVVARPRPVESRSPAPRGSPQGQDSSRSIRRFGAQALDVGLAVEAITRPCAAGASSVLR